MIAWLHGTCRDVAEDHVVLDVRGVGYEVFLAGRDLARVDVGSELSVHIHTAVREDAFLLYGFLERASRDLFRLLTSVSGVGPKGGLALLGTLEPAEVAQAIHDGQPAPLTRAKGIGKRTAELLIVRLRDRLPTALLGGALPPDATPVATGPRSLGAADAVSALTHLGYRQQTAEQTVDQLVAEGAATDDLGALITSALAALRKD